jgi:cell division protease FtsH
MKKERAMPGDNHTPESLHIPPASADEVIPYYLYEFIKSFLYAVYSKKLQLATFEVIRMTGRSDYITLKPQLLSVTDELGSEFLRVSDALVNATARFCGSLYEITLTRERDEDRIFNHIYVLGLEMGAREPDSLIGKLKRHSVETSPYRNAVLEVLSKPARWLEHEVYVEEVDLAKEELSELVLPRNVLDHISLFIEALSNYARVGKPLRFLFAGRPGTGKTKIIRAIANHCKNKATFLFTSGNERRIQSLFDFVALFSPVVLCVDDLDLMVGSRDQRQYFDELGTFLQKLDGFVQRGFFLLATTNDKQLVDLAASRPGRFDLIIDVNLIQPHQYLELVQTKTHDSGIISLFNEEILSLLEVKKVSGAFIANLIKHLELIHSFSPAKLSHDYLLQVINETYRGFYKEPESTDEKVGFEVT